LPKISIITPLYNGSKTLNESIESVLHQDYADWELILFDDGSSDGTQELAKDFAHQFPGKILYREHAGNKNYGTAYTRNRAIELADSEFISFIDQDDIYYNNRFTHQMSVFNELRNCAMIWGPALYWYKDRSFKQPVGYRGKGLDSLLYEPQEMMKIFLRDLKGTPVPGATILRRKFFEKVGGFEESIKGSEDIALWIKLSNEFPVYYDDTILIKYRKHSESTLRTASQSGKMTEWNLIFYKWVIDFLKQHCHDKELIGEYEFAYYRTLKKIAGNFSFIESRMDLIRRLRLYPDLKKKFIGDYFLDLILPFSIATKVSAKLRFDWFKNFQ
jgi:glycosyltransferase involved in cell wall biosynthesis